MQFLKNIRAGFSNLTGSNLEKRWLCQRGLFAEDMMVENRYCTIAIGRLPADVRADRERRKVRAIEFDVKGTLMPEEFTNYDPYVSYGLDDMLQEVYLEVAEEMRYK